MAKFKVKKKKKGFRLTKESMLLVGKILFLFVLFAATSYLYKFSFIPVVGMVFTVLFYVIGGAAALSVIFYFVRKFVIKSKKAAEWAEIFLTSSLIVLFIYIVGLGVGFTRLDNDVGSTHKRGQAIVNALEKYKKDNNSYPEALEKLLPSYLKEIPQTRMGLGGKFNYTFHGEGKYFTLDFPCAARSIKLYDSRQKHWQKKRAD